MKKVIGAAVLLLAGAWVCLWMLEERRQGLVKQLQEIGEFEETEKKRPKRINLSQVKNRVASTDDFFEAIGLLKDLGRDDLRRLVVEVLGVDPPNRYPADELFMRSREVILAAATEADPEWVFERLVWNGDRGEIGVAGPLAMAPFEAMMEENPERALAFYARMVEDDCPGFQKGQNANRMYQMVFAYLAKRDPAKAVEHLFSMKDGLRNMPPIELFDFESLDEVANLQQALANAPDDRLSTRWQMLEGLSGEAYRLGGIEGVREFLARHEPSVVLQEGPHYSGLKLSCFFSEKGAEDLSVLLAPAADPVRESLRYRHASEWGYHDQSGMVRWVKTLPSGKNRDFYLGNLLGYVDPSAKARRAELIGLIENEGIRAKWLSR